MKNLLKIIIIINKLEEPKKKLSEITTQPTGSGLLRIALISWGGEQDEQHEQNEIDE
jgi:hypothetical protein